MTSAKYRSRHRIFEPQTTSCAIEKQQVSLKETQTRSLVEAYEERGAFWERWLVLSILWGHYWPMVRLKQCLAIFQQRLEGLQRTGLVLRALIGSFATVASLLANGTSKTMSCKCRIMFVWRRLVPVASWRPTKNRVRFESVDCFFCYHDVIISQWYVLNKVLQMQIHVCLKETRSSSVLEVYKERGSFWERWLAILLSWRHS